MNRVCTHMEMMFERLRQRPLRGFKREIKGKKTPINLNDHVLHHKSGIYRMGIAGLILMEVLT